MCLQQTGQLTPILVSLVSKDSKAHSMLDPSGVTATGGGITVIHQPEHQLPIAVVTFEHPAYARHPAAAAMAQQLAAANPFGAMNPFGAGFGANFFGGGLGANPAALSRLKSTDSLALEHAVAAGACDVLDASVDAAAEAQRSAATAADSTVASAVPPAASLTLDVEVAAKSGGGGTREAKKWRVASRTVAAFSRRAAAGLGGSDEPLNDEEEAAIAELTSGGN